LPFFGLSVSIKLTARCILLDQNILKPIISNYNTLKHKLIKRIFFKHFTTLRLTRGFGTFAETPALNISSQNGYPKEIPI